METKTIGNKKTLTELLEKVIEETENGNTITADSLKKLCELCIKTNKMYQEQNRRGIAFEIMAKKFLSKEEFDKIDDYANQLLKLEEEDAKKNGIRG